MLLDPASATSIGQLLPYAPVFDGASINEEMAALAYRVCVRATSLAHMVSKM